MLVTNLDLIDDSVFNLRARYLCAYDTHQHAFVLKDIACARLVLQTRIHGGLEVYGNTPASYHLETAPHTKIISIVCGKLFGLCCSSILDINDSFT